MTVNAKQVFSLNPDSADELLVRPERNKRSTPPVGDKSISDLLGNMEDLGIDGKPCQLQPCRATLNDDGVADLYLGFRRARAVQTHNRGLKVDDPNFWLLSVIIDEFELSEAEITKRTIAENAYRRGPNLLEITEVIKGLIADGQTMKDISATMNIAVGAVSVYNRFDLLPPAAKKLMASGKMGYSTAEDYVTRFLPKREALLADEDGSVLAKAQARITAMIDKGATTSKDVDTATRKMADATGKGPLNKTQRNAKGMLTEIKAQRAKSVEGSYEAAALDAISEFIGGGSMKKLLKAFAEE